MRKTEPALSAAPAATSARPTWRSGAARSGARPSAIQSHTAGQKRRPKGDTRSNQRSTAPCPVRPSTTGLRPRARRWAAILIASTTGKPTKSRPKKVLVIM
ncbi:MAG: hypothetical protein E6J70_02215 [Deltaproteobacteria bacterium]|nr:MAG: hypothetical protein E6J70_02215 [Deltaproteobacteria bacterium]